MAKDPAFLFYPNDYIGGTMGMTFEEKGAYIELLMLQFNRGHMTSHMIGQSVGQIWDKIQDKFIKDAEGLYYNVRLDQEKENRKNFTNSRRNNLSGNNQHTKKEEKKTGHMISHMEDVNEDVNRIKKIVIPSEIEFLDYCKTIKEFPFSEYNFSMKSKYESWIENGWKDGNNKKITNWKSKIKNTLPHLKPMKKQISTNHDTDGIL